MANCNIHVFRPVSSLSSNGLKVHVLVYRTGVIWYELMCGYANVVHTPVQVHSVHTHILIPFADCELTGLKVDIVMCVVNSDVCINGLRSLRLHDDFFFFCIKNSNDTLHLFTLNYSTNCCSTHLSIYFFFFQ